MLVSCNTEKKRKESNSEDVGAILVFATLEHPTFSWRKLLTETTFFVLLITSNLYGMSLGGGGGGIFLTFKTSWPNVKGNTKRLFKKDKEKKVFFFCSTSFVLPAADVSSCRKKQTKNTTWLSDFEFLSLMLACTYSSHYCKCNSNMETSRPSF